MSWPPEYPGASPETWIDRYRRELAEMTEPIEKDPHPLLAENRQLRAEIARLRAENADLKAKVAYLIRLTDDDGRALEDKK